MNINQKDAKTQEVTMPSKSDQAMAEKEHNDEVVKAATIAFLDYRRALNKLILPGLGVIDDLTVTWLTHYNKGTDQMAPQSKKVGYMHVLLHTKTPPDIENGRQIFNSFAIDSNVTFENDLHPMIEEEQKRHNNEEKAKSASNEKIEEIVTAAAAAATDVTTHSL